MHNDGMTPAGRNTSPEQDDVACARGCRLLSNAVGGSRFATSPAVLEQSKPGDTRYRNCYQGWRAAPAATTTGSGSMTVSGRSALLRLALRGRRGAFGRAFSDQPQSVADRSAVQSAPIGAGGLSMELSWCLVRPEATSPNSHPVVVGDRGLPTPSHRVDQATELATVRWLWRRGGRRRVWHLSRAGWRSIDPRAPHRSRWSSSAPSTCSRALRRSCHRASCTTLRCPSMRTRVQASW